MSETFGSLWDYFSVANIVEAFFMLFIMFAILACPFLLTAANIIFFIIPPKKHWSKGLWISTSIATIFFGTLDFWFYAGYYDISITDWYEPVFPFEVHTPVSTEHMLTILVFAFIGMVGYLIMLLPVKKTPPLLFVIGISFMYFGVIVAIMWAIQTSTVEKDPMHIPFFAVFSLNMILLAANITRIKIEQYNQARKEGLLLKSKFVGLEKLLEKGERMPLYAFLLFLPLLALAIGALMLCGQDYDSFIKAWTETSDWVLSTKQSPPPLEYEGHYLCTVAAGGHRSVVKPQRDGRRHGARITVNRQLCIANAFEQVLEERTPNIHRAVRSFYDKYGYPVSKYIRTKLSADIVYIIMKPLEWVFLIVLYLADTRPERRIAVQYLPEKDKKDLLDFIDKNAEIC